MPISIESDDLGALVIDLENAGSISGKQVLDVMRKGAVNIKTEMIKDMRNSDHFKGASLINYDETLDDGVVEYEIGPEKRKGRGSHGANHANIAYFGTSKGGGTVADPLWTAEREVPNIIGWLDGIADGIL